MALAAKDLALTRGQNSAARPTRGAALSARALALIYAASPLANGNNDEFAQLLVDDKGNRLLSPEYSEEKWAKAAAAAKDVMDLGVYELYTADRRTTDSPAEPQQSIPHIMKYIAMPIIQKVGKTLTRSNLTVLYSMVK